MRQGKIGQRSSLPQDFGLHLTGRAWLRRGSYDPDALHRSAHQLETKHKTASNNLAAKPWISSFEQSSIASLFNFERPDHAFVSRDLDWGIRLTEPQVTRALAHLLDRWPNEIRQQRIGSFLRSLGVEDVVDHELEHCRVVAEEQRIDLRFTWPGRDVIVEAKFGHHITRGQLADYRSKIMPQGTQVDFILLALHASSRAPLRGRQHTIWKFCSWAQLWLQFEKTRPIEADESLPAFMNMLWTRIDRFKGIMP